MASGTSFGGLETRESVSRLVIPSGSLLSVEFLPFLDHDLQNNVKIAFIVAGAVYTFAAVIGLLG